MNSSKNAVAIIPARGGSVRIPKKNIKLFGGRPIISYSIEAAITSSLFDRVIVSTDDGEIARIAKNYGAEIPFMRPSEISNDTSGIGEVISHAIDWFTSNDVKPKYFCCIQATAPFLSKDILEIGYNKMLLSNADSAFSVATFPYTIFRALKVNASNRLEMIWPKYLETRSQDLRIAYHDAGQFYWCETDAFIIHRRFLTNNSVPVVLPRHLVQDIDTPEDWEYAEKLYSLVNKN